MQQSASIKVTDLAQQLDTTIDHVFTIAGDMGIVLNEESAVTFQAATMIASAVMAAKSASLIEGFQTQEEESICENCRLAGLIELQAAFDSGNWEAFLRVYSDIMSVFDNGLDVYAVMMHIDKLVRYGEPINCDQLKEEIEEPKPFIEMTGDFSRPTRAVEEWVDRMKRRGSPSVSFRDTDLSQSDKVPVAIEPALEARFENINQMFAEAERRISKLEESYSNQRKALHLKLGQVANHTISDVIGAAILVSKKQEKENLDAADALKRQFDVVVDLSAKYLGEGKVEKSACVVADLISSIDNIELAVKVFSSAHAIVFGYEPEQAKKRFHAAVDDHYGVRR